MSQMEMFPDKGEEHDKAISSEKSKYVTRFAEASYHYRRQKELGIDYSHPSMPWWDGLSDEEQEESKKLWPPDRDDH